MNGFEVVSFLNELQLICLHTCIAVVYTQLNSLNYCYLTLLIIFNNNHLFVDSEVVTVLLCNINNSL